MRTCKYELFYGSLNYEHKIFLLSVININSYFVSYLTGGFTTIATGYAFIAYNLKKKRHFHLQFPSG